MENVEEKILLYYPSIIIEDDGEHGQWIRNALLYWDKIATINPEQDFVNQYYEKIF